MIKSSKFDICKGKHKSISAFTLAEVLLAITVIGVIAAITITIVMPLVNERVDSYRHANIVHKITQATDNMKANGVLGKFNNTDEFVDVLEKYLKIAKRCDSEHLDECWPTQKITASDGVEYYVKNKKRRVDLGFDNDQNNPNVGIVLADGAAIIMTYNSDNMGLEQTDTIEASGKELPVGGKTKEFLEFTTNSTAGLAFLTDVNGAKGPNSETINEKMHDIRNLNGATFGGCGGTKLDGTCYTTIDSYGYLDCSRTGGDSGTLNYPTNLEFCGTPSRYDTDYWAGATQACKNIGAKLPDMATLKNDICASKNGTLKLSGWFWSSTSANSVYNRGVALRSGCADGTIKRNGGYKLLCVSK